MATIIELDENNNGDFRGFLFVAQSLSTDKTERREHFTHILIEDGRVVGSGGIRLNVYEPCHKYRSGVYRIVLKQAGRLVLLRTKGVKGFALRGRYEPLLSPDSKPIARLVFSKHKKNDWGELSGALAEIMHHLYTHNAGFNVSHIGALPPGRWVASICSGERGYGVENIVFENNGGRLVSVVMAMRNV